MLTVPKFRKSNPMWRQNQANWPKIMLCSIHLSTIRDPCNEASHSYGTKPCSESRTRNLWETCLTT